MRRIKNAKCNEIGSKKQKQKTNYYTILTVKKRKLKALIQIFRKKQRFRHFVNALNFTEGEKKIS